jgi:16S rRNA (guanine1207-N2)-methyltransferase
MPLVVANISGVELRFETAPGLFSATKPDRGSLALLSCIRFEPDDKILNLGCGYGLIGIYAARLMGAACGWLTTIPKRLSTRSGILRSTGSLVPRS